MTKINKSINKTNISQKYCKQIYFIRHAQTDWNKLEKIQGSEVDLSINQ